MEAQTGYVAAGKWHDLGAPSAQQELADDGWAASSVVLTGPGSADLPGEGPQLPCPVKSVKEQTQACVLLAQRVSSCIYSLCVRHVLGPRLTRGGGRDCVSPGQRKAASSFF